LYIVNDGTVRFSNDNQYDYILGKIVSTDPNGIGTIQVSHRCIVSVNQVNQRFVDISQYGNLHLFGDPNAFESNIIVGMDNWDGNFRVANSKVTMGFLSNWNNAVIGRDWVDANGILSVTCLRQGTVSVCPTGQLFVRGPEADTDFYESQCTKVENDGNATFSSSHFSADAFTGVDGAFTGKTFLDANVVLIIANNMEQA